MSLPEATNNEAALAGYLSERALIERRWDHLNETTRKVATKWEAVREQEINLEEEKKKMEEIKISIQEELTVEREKLITETGRLSERAAELRRREQLLEDAELKNKKIESQLTEQSSRLQKQELLLTNLINEVTSRSSQQVNSIQKLREEVLESSLLHKQDVGLQHVKQMVDSVRRKEKELALRESVLTNPDLKNSLLANLSQSELMLVGSRFATNDQPHHDNSNLSSVPLQNDSHFSDQHHPELSLNDDDLNVADPDIKIRIEQQLHLSLQRINNMVAVSSCNTVQSE